MYTRVCITIFFPNECKTSNNTHEIKPTRYGLHVIPIHTLTLTHTHTYAYRVAKLTILT